MFDTLITIDDDHEKPPVSSPSTVQQNQQRLSRNWLVSCTVRRMPSATPSSSCQGAEFHHISKGPLDR